MKVYFLKIDLLIIEKWILYIFFQELVACDFFIPFITCRKFMVSNKIISELCLKIQIFSQLGLHI